MYQNQPFVSKPTICMEPANYLSQDALARFIREREKLDQMIDGTELSVIVTPEELNTTI